MSAPTRLLIAIAALIAAPAARAEIGVMPRGTVYADSKGLAFKAPEGVGCSSSSMIVADTGNGRLLSYEWKDGVLSGGTEIRAAQVTYPVRVQLDSKGNLLVLDRKAKRIARLDAKGAFQGWIDAKGATAVVPGAFKLDASDNVWVLDLAGDAVLALDASGTVTRKLDLPRGKALFDDIAVDAAGTVYALDAVGAMVWSVEKDGTAFKPLTRSLKDVASFPAYLTTDGKGTIFVVDQNGNGLVMLGLDGSYLGRRLAIGWTEGTIYYPAQLCITAAGEMALADRGNNRVQMFSVTR